MTGARARRQVQALCGAGELGRASALHQRALCGAGGAGELRPGVPHHGRDSAHTGPPPLPHTQLTSASSPRPAPLPHTKLAQARPPLTHPAHPGPPPSHTPSSPRPAPLPHTQLAQARPAPTHPAHIRQLAEARPPDTSASSPRPGPRVHTQLAQARRRPHSRPHFCIAARPVICLFLLLLLFLSLSLSLSLSLPLPIPLSVSLSLSPSLPVLKLFFRASLSRLRLSCIGSLQASPGLLRVFSQSSASTPLPSPLWRARPLGV